MTHNTKRNEVIATTKFGTVKLSWIDRDEIYAQTLGEDRLVVRGIGHTVSLRFKRSAERQGLRPVPPGNLYEDFSRFSVCRGIASEATDAAHRAVAEAVREAIIVAEAADPRLPRKGRESALVRDLELATQGVEAAQEKLREEQAKAEVAEQELARLNPEWVADWAVVS